MAGVFCAGRGAAAAATEGGADPLVAGCATELRAAERRRCPVKLSGPQTLSSSAEGGSGLPAASLCSERMRAVNLSALLNESKSSGEMDAPVFRATGFKPLAWPDAAWLLGLGWLLPSARDDALTCRQLRPAWIRPRGLLSAPSPAAMGEHRRASVLEGGSEGMPPRSCRLRALALEDSVIAVG